MDFDSYPKTAAAYIRVSDERQDEYSPDSQIKRIREYCSAHNYDLPQEYIFYDDGISGKSVRHRSQFHDLIALAKSKEHPIDAILVWKFSRFARNQEESIVYKSLLQKIGVSVVSISEPLPEGPFGSLVERIIEWMDEYYLIRLSGEVRRGMMEKVTRGEPICAPAFGYDIRDKKYYPNADADTVRDVFQSYAAGEGMRAIARRLGDAGVRTKFGNPPDNRWVEYMLNNPVYIGKIRWCTDGRGASKRDYNNPNNMIIDGEHEHIISDELWQSVQSTLQANAIRYAKHAKKEQLPASYMLRGVFRCSACGSTLVRVNTKSPSLQCHSYARGVCNRSHSITIARATESLREALEYAARTLNFPVSIDDTPKHLTSDMAQIQKQIEAEKRRLSRAKDAYQNGVDTLEEYAENKKKITERIGDLEDKLAACLPQKPLSREECSFRIRDTLDLINNPNVDEGAKNDALLTIIDKVTFYADTKDIAISFKL